MTDFQDNTVNSAATQALPPSVPVYQQTRELVCQLIAQLQAQGKQRLPAERELAARVNCHRLSLRDALTRLENEGLIYRLNRSGWYITPPRIQYNPSKIISFHEYVAQQGQIALIEGQRQQGCLILVQSALKSATIFSLHRHAIARYQTPPGCQRH